MGEKILFLKAKLASVTNTASVKIYVYPKMCAFFSFKNCTFLATFVVTAFMKYRI